MATLSSTLIGTSDPVDLCQGFALFPALGTLRAGLASSSQTNSLININPSILLWSFTANAGYEFYAGVCGPSYAVKFSLSGETSGTQSIALNVDDDEAQAGFFVGCSVSGSVDLDLQESSLQWISDGWHSHFATVWTDSWSAHIEVEVDLLELLIDVIEALLGQTNEPGSEKTTLFQQVEHSVVPSGKSYGLFDSQTDSFASSGGQIELSPQITLPINIVPLVVLLQGIDDGLKAMGGEFSAGPSIGIAVPTTITLNQVALDSTTYGNFSYDSGADTLDGTTTGSNPDTVNNVTVTMQHQPGFDLTLGLYYDAKLLKLFSFGGNWDTGILEDLGIEPTLGPYDNTLTNAAGSTTLSNTRRVARAGQAEPVKVIFEPAGVPA